MPIETLKLPEGVEVVSLEEFNWLGFENLFRAYWQDEERIKEFLAIRKALIRKGSRFRKLFRHDATKWAISHDLLACMSIVNGDTLKQMEVLNNYWDWYSVKYKDGVSSFQQLLSEYCDDIRLKAENYRKCLGDLIDPSIIASHPKAITTINAKELKAVIAEWDREGLLDIKPTHESVLSLMGTLGYKLTKKGWEYTQ